MFGVDFEPEKVETEKRFKPKIAHIDLKYDIFAESKDQRIIVEIQKVDYDYNFDRFLLYHNMAIAEQQRTSKEYKANKTVLTIAVFTSKYINVFEKNGDVIEEDILILNNNLFNTEGRELNVFGHKMIFLNHHYIKNNTPKGYKDWLQLVKESITNPESPNVNLSNQGVKKVIEIIDYENLSPEELTETKNRNAAESIKKFQEEQIKLEIAKNAIVKNADDQFVAEITRLTIEEVRKLRKEIEKR
jgi:ribosomal protein L10